jgi:gluconate kinase
MLSEACDYIEGGDKPKIVLGKVLDGRALTDDERAFVLDQLSDYAESFR